MVFRKHILLICLIMICGAVVRAQSEGLISVQVLSQQDEAPVSSATVRIADQVGSTDQVGWVTFKSVAAGEYQITVDAMGFELYNARISKFNQENLRLTILLTASSRQIQDVQVMGQTERQRIKQAPIRSVFIDTRAASTQATSLTDLMNRSTGIRIRQNGGLGSRPEISINGFQGKAVKYFKDGIPLDFLGEGYNLSSLPMEMLDRVEVYKGVLPVSLGADALGGAVNMVTNTQKSNPLRVYYEAGSFHSHRLGLNTSKVTSDQRWGYGVEAYYNTSENDYKAVVDVINPETRNPEPMRLSMFHNAYKHYLGEGYLRLMDRVWADELKLSVTAFNMLKEQQHPALMTDAYGALHSRQNSVVPSLRYKLNVLENRLRIDQYTSFNVLNTSRIDTLRGSYNWYGVFTPNDRIGESRVASDARVNEEQMITRTNVRYMFHPEGNLELNHVFTSVNRSGEDPLGPRLKDSDTDILSLGSLYRKHVFGLALENTFLHGRLQNQLMAKYYMYQASGYQNTWFSNDVTERDKRYVQGKYWGITEAIKYQFSTVSLIRASAEYTYRLPDREELFGNQVFVVPNFELNPERSLNINVGIQSRFLENIQLEINGFYRNTENLILLVPIQAPNAQYQNQENVKGFGADVDVSYQLSKNYRLHGNVTWQDLRLFGIENAQDIWKNEARLRNTPYFFANLGSTATYSDVLSDADELQIFVHLNFMREFYLETIPRGLEAGGFLGLSGSANLNSNLKIPDQSLLNAGLSYGFLNKRIHVAAEVRNILDQDVYDYYRVQRPGKSFHVKLSYQFIKYNH